MSSTPTPEGEESRPFPVPPPVPFDPAKPVVPAPLIQPDDATETDDAPNSAPPSLRHSPPTES